MQDDRLYGPRSGRFALAGELPLKSKKRFGPANETVADIMGGWHSREGMAFNEDDGPAMAVSRTREWLNPRLEQLGLKLGEQQGKGNYGTVYMLTDMAGRPTGLVAKLTSDANEAATAHRLIASGVKSSAIPEILGAWGGVPGYGQSDKYWLIIREDIAGTCADRPTVQLCTVLSNLSDIDPTLFWSRRKPGGHGLTVYKKLPLSEQALVKRLLKELRNIKNVANVSIIDLHADNVRLRNADGRRHLVITDFGCSSGPATEVPMVKNNGINKQREMYKTLRYSATCYTAEDSPSKFDAEVKRRARSFDHHLTPHEWLLIAREVHDEAKAAWEKDNTTHKCGRCAGTGMFITRVENGKPIGPGGSCFRCGGKGVQDRHDRRRNCYYDMFGIRI